MQIESVWIPNGNCWSVVDVMQTQKSEENFSGPAREEFSDSQREFRLFHKHRSFAWWRSLSERRKILCENSEKFSICFVAWNGSDAFFNSAGNIEISWKAKEENNRQFLCQVQNKSEAKKNLIEPSAQHSNRIKERRKKRSNSIKNQSICRGKFCRIWKCKKESG